MRLTCQPDFDGFHAWGSAVGLQFLDCRTKVDCGTKVSILARESSLHFLSEQIAYPMNFTQLFLLPSL